MANRFDKYRPQAAGPNVQVFGAPDPSKELEDELRRLQIAAQSRDATADANAAKLAEQQAIINGLKIVEAQRQAEEAERYKKGEGEIQENARRMIGIAQNLKGRSKNDYFATGFGNWPMRMIPGTAAYDVAQNVQTLQGDTALDKITELRKAAPTGASPLGQTTDRDIELIKNSIAALDPGQSDVQFQTNLDELIKRYQKLLPADEQPTPNQPPPMLPRGAQGGGRIDHTQKGYYDPTGLGDGAQVNGGAGFRIQDDPALRGVNARISKMVGEGANLGQIQDYVRSLGIDPAEVQGIEAAIDFRRRNPTYNGGYSVNVDDQAVPLTGGQAAINGLGQSGPGAYFINSVDALTAGNVDSMTANPELTRVLMGQVSDDHPYWSTAGQVSGGVMGTMAINRGLAAAGKGVQALRGAKELTQPILTAKEAAQAARIAAARRGLAADTIYGAAYGAGNSDGTIADRVQGALIGGTLGHLASRGADKVVRGAGKTLTGITDPAVQYLNARGIRMTPGQMVGGKLKGREDRLTGYSGIGDDINALRSQGIEDFNRVTFDEGMSRVGGYKGPVGEQGIAKLHGDDGVIDMAFREGLDGLSIPMDPQFNSQYGAAVKGVKDVPGIGPQVRYTMVDEANDLITGPNLTGETLQDWDRLLQNRSASWRKKYASGDEVLADKAFGALDQGGEALEELVARYAPDKLKAYIGAKDAFHKSQILEDAVIAARNHGGLFTPAQLGNSVITNTKKYGGKTKAATEDRAFFELQRAAQDVLPSKVPDSGTAGRAREGGWMSRTAGAVQDAAISPLYSPALQPFIQSLLLARAPKMVKAGEKVLNNRRKVSALGAPLLLEYVYQQ